MAKLKKSRKNSKNVIKMNSCEKIFNCIKSSILMLNKSAKRNHDFKLNQFKNKNNFRLGRSPSLAIEFENYFAQELAKNFPKLKIYLDYPISLKDDKKEIIKNEKDYAI
jgi:hypothetical protein